MLLTVKMKLHPTEDQHQKLLCTMERYNEACNYVSEFAFRNKVFGKIELHKNLYYDLRERYVLSSQMVVRVFGKVSESYLTDRSCYVDEVTGRKISVKRKDKNPWDSVPGLFSWKI